MDAVDTPSFSSIAPLSGLSFGIVSSHLYSAPMLRNLYKPIYTDFVSWFSNVNDNNDDDNERQYNHLLRLDKQGTTLVYQSDSFFPMDMKGFINSTSTLKDCQDSFHNFGYVVL